MVLYYENLIGFLEVKAMKGWEPIKLCGLWESLSHELLHTQPPGSPQNYLKVHFAYGFMAPGVSVSDKRILAVILFLFLFLYLNLCLCLYLCMDILGITGIYGIWYIFLFSYSILYIANAH